MNNELMGYGDVARALNTTPARVKGLLKGLEPAQTVQNGRVALFGRKEVQQALYEAHKDVIDFIGYLSPTQSYDVTVSVDTDASL